MHAWLAYPVGNGGPLSEEALPSEIAAFENIAFNVELIKLHQLIGLLPLARMGVVAPAQSWLQSHLLKALL